MKKLAAGEFYENNVRIPAHCYGCVYLRAKSRLAAVALRNAPAGAVNSVNSKTIKNSSSAAKCRDWAHIGPESAGALRRKNKEGCDVMADVRFEELKAELFNCGQEAIEDFLGHEIDSDEDKDVIDRRMDMVYEQMPDEELVKFYEKYQIGPVRELAGEQCVCYEAGKPGMMRLALEGCFGPKPEDNRSTLMLIPMDMVSEEIDMLSDMWLTEQEKEMGLKVGESCSSSSWWAGHKDDRHDGELTDKYDWLVERCYSKPGYYEKEQSIRELAGRLVDFIKDVDFYHYQDTLGPGGDEEAVRETELDLVSKDGVTSLVDALNDIVCEGNLTEAQHTEARRLIEDLTSLGEGFDSRSSLDAQIKDASDRGSKAQVSSVTDKGEVGLEF